MGLDHPAELEQCATSERRSPVEDHCQERTTTDADAEGGRHTEERARAPSAPTMADSCPPPCEPARTHAPSTLLAKTAPTAYVESESKRRLYELIFDDDD